MMTQMIHYLSQYVWFAGIPILFLAAVAWTYRPGSRRRYRKDAEIPFREDPGASSAAGPL
jgi:cbb3-type cytochrome oxidase subunit 3